MNSELVRLLTMHVSQSSPRIYYIAIELIVLLTGLHLWFKYNSVSAHTHSSSLTLSLLFSSHNPMCFSFVKHRKRLLLSRWVYFPNIASKMPLFWKAFSNYSFMCIIKNALLRANKGKKYSFNYYYIDFWYRFFHKWKHHLRSNIKWIHDIEASFSTFIHKRISSQIHESDTNQKRAWRNR